MARSIIAEGRRTLDDPELSTAETLHELRKALKRWRSLMHLLSGELGSEAKQLRAQARDLKDQLNAARDAQAALDAFNDLRRADPKLHAKARPAVEKRLVALRHAAERDIAEPLQHRLSQYFDDCELAVERWPLKDIEFESLADALTAGYRRARSRVPKDWTAAPAQQLHNFRRHVVEHRNQLELIERCRPGAVQAMRAERLRSRLGACQDLAVLEQILAHDEALALWNKRLVKVIKDRRRSHLERAERIANRLYSTKPKAFRREITALG